MISKKSVIYRFLCIWWVLINMAPRNSDLIYLIYLIYLSYVRILFNRRQTLGCLRFTRLCWGWKTHVQMSL